HSRRGRTSKRNKSGFALDDLSLLVTHVKSGRGLKQEWRDRLCRYCFSPSVRAPNRSGWKERGTVGSVTMTKSPSPDMLAASKAENDFSDTIVTTSTDVCGRYRRSCSTVPRCCAVWKLPFT